MLGPFIKHLISEHEEIRAKLIELHSLFRKSPGVPLSDLLTEVQKARRFIVEVHHKKEEDLLFPLLPLPELRSGGPKCTMYMGLKIMGDAAKVIFDLPHDQEKTYGYFLEHKKYFDGKSPLSIPLEEHVAGATVLDLLEAKLQSEDSLETRAEAEKLFRMYKDLIELHSEKEDTCLFMMANRLVSLSKQEELLEQAKQITK